jgi:minor histocompatibility antigen H13
LLLQGADVEGKMVKVATTLDAPIKILWPKSSDFSSAKGFTMLGLGDIVIPGAFVTLALRRDLFVSPERNPHVRFAKPYFTAALVSYVLGLVSTMVVMHTWKKAQPALLYLRSVLSVC